MALTSLLFDLDDVLCHYDTAARVARIAAMTGLTPAEVTRRVFDDAFFAAADTGAFATGNDYLAAFNRRLGVPLTRDQWIEARRCAMRPFPDMLALVRHLSERGFATGIFTNNDPLVGEAMQDLFPEVAALFDGRIVISAGLGRQKPEPEAFRAACAQLGFDPAATLFTDDRPENVEGARAAGCHAHLFEGIANYRACLAALGIAA